MPTASHFIELSIINIMLALMLILRVCSDVEEVVRFNFKSRVHVFFLTTYIKQALSLRNAVYSMWFVLVQYYSLHVGYQGYYASVVYTTYFYFSMGSTYY